MRLSDSSLKDKKAWEDRGYALPLYDRASVIEKTKKEPEWIHFGSGNIFRAFIARLQNRLLNRGIEDKGIIVAEGFDYEIIDDIYTPYDNLSLLVTLKANGGIDKEIISSVTESLKCDYSCKDDWKRLTEIFSSPSLKLASFTITEKGYTLKDASGNYLDSYKSDFERGMGNSRLFLPKLVELLYERYKSSKSPIALVSMDNCSKNGGRLKDAVLGIALEWVKRGFIEKEFLDYLKSENVSFPVSMIDKITPRPSSAIRDILSSDGFESTSIIKTSKSTYIAPFVNSEEKEYLVIEDDFPNGRPRLEEAGVYFTDRATVEKCEKMKVGTCLNPLHTALAVFGCLLGYRLISDEMKDPDLVKLIRQIGYAEGLSVASDPKIIDPKSFLDEVIEVRLPNPFMPDTPERIMTDTSEKIPIRFGGTIKSYIENGLSLKKLKCIPLVFAAWLRYLVGVDDNGEAMSLSPDPQLEYLRGILSGIGIGYEGELDPLDEILSNSKIFSLDLTEIGLSETVKSYFRKMIAKKGSVRETLHETLTGI